MSSENGVPGASSCMGNGSGGDQQAAEHAVVAVAPPPPPSPPAAPQPEPVPVAMEHHDADVVVVEIHDSPQPEPDSPEETHDEMEVVELDSLSPPEAAVEEIGDDVVAAPRSPLPQAAGEEGEFICDICRASYATEKAMFGHLRCHKDRAWRGAFCPPTFSMDEFAEYQEHLVKSEEDQLKEIEAEETALVLPPPGSSNAPPPPPPLQVTEEAGESSQKVVLDLDLNVKVEEFVIPDLNLLPPDVEEE